MDEAATNEATDEAIEKLKHWQPKSLLVYCADGDVKPVTIPERRRKWAAVQSVLVGLHWVKLEAKGKDGGILGIVRNGDDAGTGVGLEDLSAKGKQGEVAFYLTLMLKAQDVALKRDESRLKTLVDQQTRLVDIVVKRLVSLETKHMEQLGIISDLSAAAGMSDDDSLSGKMIEAVGPVVVKELMAGVAVKRAAAAAEKANGAK